MSGVEGSDLAVASLAAGFTLGFGFLTTWNAVRQTRTIRTPWRSVYIYMVWGEILANTALGIIGYLFINGVLPPNLPVLFIILSLWVFQLHLLMQIIINRIAVVVDNRRMIKKLKWGTFLLVFMVNISVFCIWIPAHLSPPPIPVLVEVNKYWDRIEKVIIFSIDGGLNYYFLRVVQKRLLDYHGLKKYKPLVTFNARIMVVSIALDIMLIALMQLKNPQVYVQFHPLVYMVKLNIELSMATLIKKLARSGVDDNRNEFLSDHHSSSNHRSQAHPPTVTNIQLKNGVSSSAIGGRNDMDGAFDFQGGGIMTVKEVDIKVHMAEEDVADGAKSIGGSSDGYDDRKPGDHTPTKSDDQIPLAYVDNRPNAW